MVIVQMLHWLLVDLGFEPRALESIWLGKRVYCVLLSGGLEGWYIFSGGGLRSEQCGPIQAYKMNNNVYGM